MTFTTALIIAYQAVITIFRRKLLTRYQQQDNIIQLIFVKISLTGKLEISQILLSYFNPAIHG